MDVQLYVLRCSAVVNVLLKCSCMSWKALQWSTCCGSAVPCLEIQRSGQRVDVVQFHICGNSLNIEAIILRLKSMFGDRFQAMTSSLEPLT